IYASANQRAPSSVLSRNRAGQSALWAYGISGDVPIAVLRVADQGNVQIARQMLKAHAYWLLKGLVVDLVILNDDASTYRQVLHEDLMSLIPKPADGGPTERPGGIFLRRADQVSEDDKVLLQTVARLVLS